MTECDECEGEGSFDELEDGELVKVVCVKCYGEGKIKEDK